MLFRLIIRIDTINHQDIAHLSVPVAASDALFDTLGIPGEIIIDNNIAKLHVQALSTRFR
jgi:hypothetical protein